MPKRYFAKSLILSILLSLSSRLEAQLFAGADAKAREIENLLQTETKLVDALTRLRSIEGKQITTATLMGKQPGTATVTVTITVADAEWDVLVAAIEGYTHEKFLKPGQIKKDFCPSVSSLDGARLFLSNNWPKDAIFGFDLIDNNLCLFHQNWMRGKLLSEEEDQVKFYTNSDVIRRNPVGRFQVELMCRYGRSACKSATTLSNPVLDGKLALMFLDKAGKEVLPIVSLYGGDTRDFRRIGGVEFSLASAREWRGNPYYPGIAIRKTSVIKVNVEGSVEFFEKAESVKVVDR